MVLIKSNYLLFGDNNSNELTVGGIMAKITSLSTIKYDYIKAIQKFVDTDDFECIRLCLKALADNKLSIEDKMFIYIQLGKSYNNIGENEYAIYQLKQALMIKHYDDDALYNIFLSYININAFPAYKEIFYVLHYNAQNRDLVDSALSILFTHEDVSSFKMDMFDDEVPPLMIVSEKEKLERLLVRVEEYANSGKINETMEYLAQSMNKYGHNEIFLEYYIMMSGFCVKYDVMHKIAEILYDINHDNASSIMAGLIYCAEVNDQELTNIWTRRAWDSKIIDDDDKCYKILIGLDNVDEYQLGLDYIARIQDNATRPCYMFASAVFNYKLGNSEIAINILKQMNSLYGDRSFAKEAIYTIKRNGDIDISEYHRINDTFVTDHMSILVARLENATVKEFSINFLEVKDLLRVAALAGEFGLISKAISNLSVGVINREIDFFNKLLVDDLWVTTEMKINIIFELLIKSPNIKFKFCINGMVEKSSFELPMKSYKAMNSPMNTAYAFAYAVGCINGKDFKHNLMKSYLKAFDKVIAKPNSFDNYKALAAVLSLGAYMYYGGNVKDKVIACHDCDRKVFDKYLKAINKGKSFYSEEEQEFIFNEILEKFAVELINADEFDNDDDDD